MGLKSKLLGLLKSDNSLSLIGNLVFAFLGFANVFLLVRSYPKDVFGEWVLYLAGMALLEMIRKGVTSTPLVRFLSGSDNEEERQKIIGSSWLLSIAVTLVILILFIPIYSLFGEAIDDKGFGLLFKFYPVLAIVILPLNTGLSILQADRKFGSILSLRFVNMFFFFVFLILNFFWLKLSIVNIVWIHIIAHLLASLYAMLRKWSGVIYLLKATREALKTQLSFGKYSLGTLIGSNLLKSSDTFIIGLMLAEPEVAFYAIPIKLIEIIEIPIRSFVAVAFPKMSKASREGNNELVRSVFYQYAGIVSWIFIPLVAFLFLIANPLVLLFGGAEYADSALIFKIFLIYALLLPLDRFSGIGLDAINKPNLNMLKVILMASANIIGDIIAIHYFKSLEAVAVVTIVNVLVGVLVGNWYLKRELGIQIRKVYPTGLKEIKGFVKQFRS